MAITQDRMEGLINAGLSCARAWKGLRDEILIAYQKQFDSCIKPGGDGTFTPEMALIQIMERAKYYQPDTEGLLLLGREESHFRATRHKNNRTRNLMRARRGNIANPPDMSFLPNGVPRHNPVSQSPMRDPGYAPPQVHPYAMTSEKATIDEVRVAVEQAEARRKAKGLPPFGEALPRKEASQVKLTRPDFSTDTPPVILGPIDGLAADAATVASVASVAGTPEAIPLDRVGLPSDLDSVGELDPLTARVPGSDGKGVF